MLNAHLINTLLLATTLLTLKPCAFATEIPEHYLPVRPLGMGGAFTAVANDEHSAWTNPAGVARVRKARSRSTYHGMRAPNLTLGVNSSAQAFYQGFQSAEGSVSDFVTSSAAEDGSTSQSVWVGTSSFPNAMFDYDGLPVLVGFYNYTRGRVFIDSETPESAEFESISDVGGILSMSFTNRTNRANFGLSLRYVGRFAYEDTIPTDELSDNTKIQERFEANFNQSSAVAIDIGTLLTLADFWYPTLGIAILNLPLGCKSDYLNPFNKLRESVCGTKFTGTVSNEDAMSVVDPVDLRVGMSISPRITREMGLRIAVDVHHLPISSGSTTYGLQGIDYAKLVHAGVEIYSGNPLVPSKFSVRAGMNQGFFTAGATIISGPVLLEFATYGVDVSSTAKRIEDRRVLSTFSFVF